MQSRRYPTPFERFLIKLILAPFEAVAWFLFRVFNGPPKPRHRVWVVYPTGHYELHVSHKKGDMRPPL